MSESSADVALRELTEQLRRFEVRLDRIETQLERLGDAAEYFVHRSRRSDERVAEEFTRQRMGRDPFSD